MIKAVIFDLDDTLISEKEYIRSGFKVVSDKIGSDFNLDAKYIYEIIYSEFEVDSKNVFNRTLDKLEVEYEIEYIKELINTYRNHMPNIKLYDDAKYIIEKLYSKGIKLGIITDGYAVTQRNKLNVLNIEKYFEHIIVTDELGREYWKPHKKSYELMKLKLNLDYEEMIYVGDNISKDFVTANKLGMHTVMINREDGVYSNLKFENEYKAKIEVMDLKDISRVIDTLGEKFNEENIICNYS